MSRGQLLLYLGLVLALLGFLGGVAAGGLGLVGALNEAARTPEVGAEELSRSMQGALLRALVGFGVGFLGGGLGLAGILLHRRDRRAAEAEAPAATEETG
jgi:hypothetical protein